MGPNSCVRAVVLAAGKGKRMKSALPKVLHEVLGKPMLSRVLDVLDELRLEHIHIVVGHGAKEVEDYLALNPPETSWSCHRQDVQLGTGHALMQVVPVLKKFTGTLLITTGDMPLLTSSTFKHLIQLHRDKQATLSLLTTVMPDAGSYGRILRDVANKVQGIVEHADASEQQKTINEINTSAYCLEWPAIASGLQAITCDNQQKEYYLTDLIGWAYREKLSIAGHTIFDWQEVQGINSRLDLAEVSRLLNTRVIRKLTLESGVTVMDPQSTWIAPEVEIGSDTVIMPGCYLMGNVQIGSSCTIGPHTVMHGPVKIGDGTSINQSLLNKVQIGNHCRVGPFAHLREMVLLADEVKIGNFVEIKKSTVGTCSQAMHLSYLGDATIGQNVNIGAGTITANYDHVSKVKSRTNIDDGVATGCNSVLVAPVVVGKEAVVAAGTVVTSDVPDRSLVVRRAKAEIKPDWTVNRRRQLKLKKEVEIK